MSSALTKEEVMQWRRSTEKITLEEFAQRLGKSLEAKKETNDLHDLFLRKKDDIQEELSDIDEARAAIKAKEARRTETAEDTVKAEKAIEPKEEKQEKPDFEIKLSFNKKLNKREEIVLNYFCKNRKQKVSVGDLASVLGLPNDYVYKYIKNLRTKLKNNVLVNAEQGGYILNI